MWYKAPIHMTKRKYTPEFKKEALKLAQKLGSFAESERQLGIREGVIYTWKNKFKVSVDANVKTAQVAIAETEEIK